MGQSSSFLFTTRSHDPYLRPIRDPPSHSGPGFQISDFASNTIIAQKQVDGAQTIMNAARTPVQGPVTFVHTYLNMYVWAWLAKLGEAGTDWAQVLSLVPVAKWDNCADMPTSYGIFVRRWNYVSR